MDQREIQSKGAALTKAITAKEPSENILNILRDLKTNVKPTEDVLRATGIGKIVNRVKGAPGLDPEVSKLASEIISRWRHVVNAQKLASGTSTPVGATNGARSNGTNSPAPTSKPKASSPTGVDPDKRNWKSDKVSRDDLTDDKNRNNCIGLLYDGLCIGSERPMKEILQVAVAVENAALNLPETKGNPSSGPYKEKIRSLFQNLKNKSNPKLKTRILDGTIHPERFVTMTHDEMKSKQQRAEDEKIAKENMNNAMVAQEEKSISTALECGKCHQKKVSYTQAQTRSADEPMTTFCECLNCGNRWKFS
jgi:transcription elongation factor S-II